MPKFTMFPAVTITIKAKDYETASKLADALLEPITTAMGTIGGSQVVDDYELEED